MPRWSIGWDVFCWLGHRRFARHWSVPQLRAELLDSYAIALSADAIEDYLQRYQCMLAARQQDFALLKKEYATTRAVVLSIDGLQPEKGHETEWHFHAIPIHSMILRSRRCFRLE